jgi:protein tyrosine phosphatase (PTP) superfamily phosphohydrolase (DUF442 family)
MSMKKLSDQFYVGPQIEIDDIEDIQISGHQVHNLPAP